MNSTCAGGAICGTYGDPYCAGCQQRLDKNAHADVGEASCKRSPTQVQAPGLAHQRLKTPHLRRRLEHDRIASHQRRCDLRHREVDWVVEGRDAEHRAEGHLAREAQLAALRAGKGIAVQQLALAEEAHALLCAVRNELRGADDFRVCCFRGLCHLGDEDAADRGGVLAQRGGDGVQVLRAPPERGGRPRALHGTRAIVRRVHLCLCARHRTLERSKVLLWRQDDGNWWRGIPGAVSGNRRGVWERAPGQHASVSGDGEGCQMPRSRLVSSSDGALDCACSHAGEAS